MKLKEYADDIGAWAPVITERRQNILERMTILRKEMCTIVAESDGLNLEERRRSADVVNKLSGSITDLEDKIDEIDGRLEPVEIIIDKLKNIIGLKIKDINDPKTRQVLMDVLHELSTGLSDLLVQEKSIQ
jgi:hypothetical protein